jgi:hypothetical protein
LYTQWGIETIINTVNNITTSTLYFPILFTDFTNTAKFRIIATPQTGTPNNVWVNVWPRSSGSAYVKAYSSYAYESYTAAWFAIGF